MEEEIYHAELADAKREANILNGLAGTTVAVAIVFLMLEFHLEKLQIMSPLNQEKKMAYAFLFGREVI